MDDNLYFRVTSLGSFEFCRRRWWWDENYTLPEPNPNFWFGNGAHATLKGFYEGGRSVGAGWAAFEDWDRAFYTEFEEQYPGLPWSMSGADEVLANLKVCLSNYFAFEDEYPLGGHIGSVPPILEVEKRLVVPVLNPVTREPVPGVFLTGQLDLALEKPDGVWIVDHKTYGPRSVDTHPDVGLDVDEQLTAYAYLYWRTTGVIPGNVVYNILIKSFPAKPRLLNSGRLSKDKSQPTTVSLYLEAIEENHLDPRDYEDMLVWLQEQNRWDKYFTRPGSTRNLQELLAFERRAFRKIEAMLQAVHDPEEYAWNSPAATWKCGQCPYLTPCKEKDAGGNPAAILDTYIQKIPLQLPT